MGSKILLIVAVLIFSLGCMGYEIKKTEPASSSIGKEQEQVQTTPPKSQAPLDSDGLTDVEEKNLGTNPKMFDSDMDGLSDYVEVKETKTNPLKSDTDGDGLNDLEEKNLGTNPLMTDSDNDGLSDYIEVKETKTDPIKYDTDGDGLNDGEEIQAKTNPRVQDTDGDGLSDYKEVKIIGSNPLKLNTDGDRYDDGQDPNPIKVNSATIQIQVIKNEGYWNEQLKSKLYPILGCLVIYAAESSLGEVTGIVASLCTYVLAGMSIPNLAVSDIAYREVEIQLQNIGDDYTSFVQYKMDVHAQYTGKPMELFDGREVRIGVLKPGDIYTDKIKYTFKVKDYTIGVLKNILEGKTGDRQYIFKFVNLQYEKF